MSKEEIRKLIEEAKKAEKAAFIFKSNHNFGAAVMTTEGEIYGGCNVDGVISSQGMCAEMMAINHAVVHGKYNFRAMAVVDEEDFIWPCGACLQYLAQFYQTTGEEIVVVAAKEDGEYRTKTLSELLPEKYLSSSFGERLKQFKNK